MKHAVLRKTAVLLLAMCLVLGLSLTAFAATGSIALDNYYIREGETVTVTVSLDEAVTNISTLRYDLYFNDERFELVSSEKGDSHSQWVLGKRIWTNKTDGGKYYPISVLDATSEGLTVNPGTVYTLTFKALANSSDSEVVESFELRFANGAHPDNSEFTEDAGDPAYLVVSPAKSDDMTYIADMPQLSDNLTLNEIVLNTDVEIKSQTWDGDTLNVVLAEGTADETNVEAEFHVSMRKADGDKGDYEFNDGYNNLTVNDYNVHRVSGKIEDGKLTLTGAFTLCTSCADEEKAEYDLVFTPKTYTLNFTVEAPTEHTITINKSANGTVTADKETAVKDDIVTLTVTPNSGYKLDTLTVKAGDTDITVTDNKFTMPDADVTVTATFVEDKKEEPESLIQSVTTNGTGAVTVKEQNAVTIDDSAAVPYQIVTIPADATEAYVTYRAGTELSGTVFAYRVQIPEMTLGESNNMEGFSGVTNDDGTVTLTIELKDYMYLNNGTGYGLAPSTGLFWFEPVHLIAFEKAAATTHTCTFNQRLCAVKYQKTPADCENAAVYYYSCACGKVGTETFTSGGSLGHNYENGACTRCGKLDPAVSQYTVSLEGGKTVSAGETVEIPVTIGHTDSDVTTYNAFDVTFTYDPAALQLDMADTTDLTITDHEGTLRILRYGESKNVGEPAFTLKFTALTAGETNITTSAALVGISNGAIEGDANTAAVTTKTTGIIVEGYTVNLPEGFTGETKVNSGESYTFTANDKNYTYDLSATMGGEAVTVTDNGDGSFTIANVNGNLVITLNEKTGKIFNVTLVGDGLTGPNSAQYMQDYNAKLTKESGYTYKLDVTVNGKPVTYSSAEGGEININGQYITGDVKIVVTKTQIASKSYGVTFEGNAAGEVSGSSSVTANATYTFTVNKAEGATYTVTATMGGKEITVTETDNGYSIAKVTGDLVITVDKQTDLTVEVSTYLELDGKTLFLVKANGTLPEGYAYAYDGTAMFKSEAYDGSWVYLVMVEDGTLTAEDAKDKIVSAEMDYTTLSKTCDVNGTGKVDVNDAQLVYDLYNTKYADFTQVSMEKFLKADTTADGKVDVADATAIVSEINNLR